VHRTLQANKRFVLAMRANGFFEPEQLAAETGIPLNVIQSTIDGDLSKLDIVSAVKLKTALRSYSLCWLLFGEGDPNDALARLTVVEQDIIDSFRTMTSAGQDMVKRTVRRYTPKKG
jgi:hypothetical protein